METIIPTIGIAIMALLGFAMVKTIDKIDRRGLQGIALLAIEGALSFSIGFIINLKP